MNWREGCNQSAAKLPLVLGAFLRSRTAMKQSFELPLTPTGCVTPKPTQPKRHMKATSASADVAVPIHAHQAAF